MHVCRLVIQGVGFSADRYTGGNVVTVGPYPCNVINHLTTDSLITCETTPGNFGTYVVTVVVDGTYSASSCCFSYDRSRTPSKSSSMPWPPALGGAPCAALMRPYLRQPSLLLSALPCSAPLGRNSALILSSPPCSALL